MVIYLCLFTSQGTRSRNSRKSVLSTRGELDLDLPTVLSQIQLADRRGRSPFLTRWIQSHEPLCFHDLEVIANKPWIGPKSSILLVLSCQYSDTKGSWAPHTFTLLANVPGPPHRYETKNKTQET
jgi:hypothetical protein